MSEAATGQGSGEPLLPAVTIHVTRIDMARWNNYVQNRTTPRVTWIFRYIPVGFLLFLAVLNFTT